MPAIYICYRKEDAFGEAAHLYKEFSQRFGKGGVFMDVARAEPGRDFRLVVDDHVARSGVCLVLVGRTWVEGRDAAGQRRLDNPLDPVRTEVAAALAHHIPIIPVLVQRAGMVQPADLPADMVGLAHGRPIELTQAHWGSDVETLLDFLQSQKLVPAPGDAGFEAPPVAPLATRSRGATVPGALASNGRAARKPAQPVAPWRLMLAAALAVAVAIGAYLTMPGRKAAVEPTVSDALGAAQTAVAKAEAAKAEAEAAARAVAAPAPAPAQTSVPSAAPAVPDAAAADKAKAEREAAAIKAAEQAAQKRKAAKEEAEQAARMAREAKQQAAIAEAAKAPAPPKAAPDKPATAAAPVAAAAPAAPTAANAPVADAAQAGARSYSMKWTLRSSACGPAPVTVTGTARFTIEKTAEGIVVTENFRGSGGGVEAVTTGKAVFSKEQPSYDIPTTVEWSGARTFRSTGVDRVNASNGTQPTGARLVKLQSDCG